MLSINPLSQTDINEYSITLAELFHEPPENNSDKDIYTLITVNNALNTHIYIPEDEDHPIQIDKKDSINTYNCANCQKVKTTRIYYGCTWSGDHIRNKDILLCVDCYKEITQTYNIAIENSLGKFLVDLI